MSRIQHLVVIGITIVSVSNVVSKRVLAQQSDASPVALLSPPAMDALVSSCAFYRDPVIEHILSAAQDPQSLHVAAVDGVNSQTDESLLFLAKYPELLQQLDSQLALTARLGVAARTQINDVWDAIDRVRKAYKMAEATYANQPATVTNVAAVPVPTAYVPAGYIAYTATLWADAVIDELNDEYNVYVASQTATGPAGTTATTGTVSGQVPHGDTTVAGVAGAGAVTGPAGNTVYGVGGAAGSVTNTGSGYNTSSVAGGAVYNPATGNYAGAVRSGDASTSQNADGTTSFDRSATTQTVSSYGSSTITHEGAGTAGGIGNSSYNGSSSIDSTHGNASIETSAGNGQVTSTVTTDNGSHSVTAGDGQFGSQSQSTARESQSASSAQRSFARNSGQAGNFNEALAGQGLSARSNTLKHEGNASSRFGRSAGASRASSVTGADTRQDFSRGSGNFSSSLGVQNGIQTQSRGTSLGGSRGGARSGRGGRR
ncbi:DUF3300 domain-containing protein [Stieleria sp. JC731]|uniref:DUF3300 domain-containing protein n=1 Tax=Stieleria sp. JC731 TaxID=2894195 RepID=UPI001E483500|nr:DUF3300 domain-containing protein [Stieleria sp. JC731]MCC9599102.1 DUF3300 domain-containing protein [Stieleria sp. JC731]